MSEAVTAVEIILDICIYASFFAFLSYAAITDIKKRVIYNWSIFGTVILWIIWRAASAAIVLVQSGKLEPATTDSIFEMVVEDMRMAIGAICVYVMLLLITVAAEKIAGGYLFGGGDIKLVAVVSLYFGIAGAMVALFAGCMVSLVYAAAKSPRGIPFAPCMLCGALVTALM